MKYTKEQKENLKEYNKLNEWFKNHVLKLAQTQ